MKLNPFVALLLSLLGMQAAFAGGVRRPMALFLFVDGGRADCFVNASCPALTALKDGKWADGYSCAWSMAAVNNPDSMTYSYANHASILTGVTSHKHNVLFNRDIHDGDFKKWPTWVNRLQAAKPDIRALYVFTDWADLTMTKNDKAATRMDVRKLAVKDAAPHELDVAAADYAAQEIVKPDAADVTLLFLHAVDTAGHLKRWSSEDYHAEFTASDTGIGKVLAAIKARATFADEDWLITFVTDHGGRHYMHGSIDGHCQTIPLLVAGRHVPQGEIPGRPRHYDLPATALAHFGVKTEGLGLDGRVIGQSVLPVSGKGLSDDLVYWLPFNDRYVRQVPNLAPNGGVATGWGDLEFLAMVSVDPAKDPAPSRGFCRIIGDTEPTAIRLDATGGKFVSGKDGFTIAFWLNLGSFWLKGGTAKADGFPVVLGNADLSVPNSPGFAILQNMKTPRYEPGVGLQYLGAAGKTEKLGAFLPDVLKWNFYAVTVRPDGTILFCHGRPEGAYNWMAGSTDPANLVSGNPIYLGEDGTGRYLPGLMGGFDEVVLWSRALTLEEVRTVFEAGRAKEATFDFGKVPAPALKKGMPVEASLKAK